MDIWEFRPKPLNPDGLDEKVKAGQKVLITRMVTFSYEVDVADILDGTGEEDISLKELISGEEGENDFSAISDYNDETDKVDDIVISAEII